MNNARWVYVDMRPTGIFCIGFCPYCKQRLFVTDASYTFIEFYSSNVCTPIYFHPECYEYWEQKHYPKGVKQLELGYVPSTCADTNRFSQPEFNTR